jgi:hypothetical protein
MSICKEQTEYLNRIEGKKFQNKHFKTSKGKKILGYQENDTFFKAGTSLCLLRVLSKITPEAITTERISEARKTIKLESSNVL